MTAEHNSHYKIYTDLFEFYSKKLTEKEDTFKNIFQDFFKKALFSEFMKKKNELMNGVECTKDEKKRKKHIAGIQEELNKAV